MVKRVLITALAAGAASLVVLYAIRRLQSRYMRRRIASEGFETATDILYPHKRRRFSKHKIGPVLPQK